MQRLFLVFMLSLLMLSIVTPLVIADADVSVDVNIPDEIHEGDYFLMEVKVIANEDKRLVVIIEARRGIYFATKEGWDSKVIEDIGQLGATIPLWCSAYKEGWTRIDISIMKDGVRIHRKAVMIRILEARYIEITQQLEICIELIRECSKRISGLYFRVKQLEYEVARLSLITEDHEKRIGVLEGQLGGLIRRIRIIESRLTVLEQEVDQLRLELDEILEWLEEVEITEEGILEELLKHHKKIKKLEGSISILQDEIELLELQLDTLYAKHQTMKRNLTIMAVGSLAMFAIPLIILLKKKIL